MKKIIRCKHIFTEAGVVDGYIEISGGIITRVIKGELSEKELDGAEFYDYEQGMVIPGLIDTHCFFMGKYFQEYGENYKGCGSIDLILDFINRGDKKLVLGRNISEEVFRDLQNRTLPNIYPIVLFHESYEEMLVNEEAERCYGVHTGSVTMEGCVHLIEETMNDKKKFIESYEKHVQELHQRGITGVKEIIFDKGFGYLEALGEYRERNDGLTIRTTVVSQPVANTADITWGVEMKRDFNHDDLRFYGFNMMLDGSMSQEEAHLKNNYLGKAHNVKTEPDYEIAYSLVKESDEKNLAVSLHAQGGKAVEEGVRIFASMKKDENGKLLNRHSLTDLEMGEAVEFKKMAELGVHAEIYPQIQSIYEDWKSKIRQVKGHVGEEYAKIWNRKAMMAEGVSVSCATDLPLLFPSLPESIYYGCGSFLGGSEEPFLPENAADRISMIKAWTSGGISNVYGEEVKLGKIENGFVADFVIYDRNLLTESYETIRDAEVLLTISNGEVVYKSKR